MPINKSQAKNCIMKVYNITKSDDSF